MKMNAILGSPMKILSAVGIAINNDNGSSEPASPTPSEVSMLLGTQIPPWNADNCIAEGLSIIQKAGMTLSLPTPAATEKDTTHDVHNEHTVSQLQSDEKDNTNTVDLPPTAAGVKSSPLQDIPSLFEALGALTERLKGIERSLTPIQNIENTVKELKDSIRSELANVQARVLINEESIIKLEADLKTEKDFRTNNVKPVVKKLEKNNFLDTLINNNIVNKVATNEQNIEQLRTLITSNTTNNNEIELSATDIQNIADVLSVNASASVNELKDKVESLCILNKDAQDRIVQLENSSTTKLQPKNKSSLENVSLKRSNVSDDNHVASMPASPSQRKQKSGVTNATLSRDAIIVGDSNTSYLDMKRMGRGYTRKRYTCYTIEQVIAFVKTAKIENEPKKLLIHVGTNDVGYMNVNQLKKQYRELLELLKQRFPETRVYLSSAFYRKEKEKHLKGELP